MDEICRFILFAIQADLDLYLQAYLKPFGRCLCIFAMGVHCIIDELRVIAELLQGGDGRQDPGRDFLVLSLKQPLGCIGCQKVAVQLLLELCHLTADYLDDL